LSFEEIFLANVDVNEVRSDHGCVGLWGNGNGNGCICTIHISGHIYLCGRSSAALGWVE